MLKFEKRRRTQTEECNKQRKNIWKLKEKKTHAKVAIRAEKNVNRLEKELQSKITKERFLCGLALLIRN